MDNSEYSAATNPDRLINQYRLEALITQTNATDLYRAFDVDEDREVALEILLPTFNKQYRERFVEKMRLVAQLKHPNIAQIYQIGQTPTNRPYVARQLIDGYPLGERIAQLSQQSSSVNSIYALKLVRQIAEALSLAERLDLFHHYLSPQHIMLRQDGTVVLVDLGIPVANNGTAVSLDEHIEKNPAYLSPEQQQGKPIDSRSHIYSMGVILYELLVGALPGQSYSLWQTIRRRLSSQESPIEQARPGLSPKTYDLIEKCLRKEPWSRHQNLSGFIEDVDEALQAERLLVSDAGTTTLPRVQTGRPLWQLLIPVALLLLCGVFALVALQARDPDTTQLADGTANQVALPESSTGTPPPTATVTPIATAASATETAVTIAVDPEATIDIQEPPPNQTYEIGQTIVFTWTWPLDLDPAHQFTVYVTSGGQTSELGSVTQRDEDGLYRLETTTAFAPSAGTYEWQVVLEEAETREALVKSAIQLLEVVVFTATPTATATAEPTDTPTPIPTATNTATATPTLTPPPTLTPVPPTPIPPTNTPVPPTPVPTQPPPPPPTPTPPVIPPTATPPPPPTNTPPPLPTSTP